MRPLVAKRAVSQMEALKLSQDIATLNGKLTELKNTYFQDAYTERSQRKADLSALEPIISSARTSCAAPRSCRRCAGGSTLC